MSGPCIILPDPDVAGKGVRVAVYIQALLPMISHALISCIVSGTSAERQTALAKQVYESTTESSRDFLLTSGALLVTAYIKHSNRALSPYHAIIVLNLTWIVYLSASFSGRMLQGVWPMAFPSVASRLEKQWATYRCVEAQRVRYLDDPWALLEAAFLSPSPANGGDIITRPSRGRKPSGSDVIHPPSSGLQLYIFLSIHLIGIGALGYILFRDVDGFSSPGSCASETVLWTFGARVHISSPSVQRRWHGLYVAALVPGLGASGSILLSYPGYIALMFLRIMRPRATIPQNVPLWANFVVTLALVALLITSTEITISANLVGAGEDAWGFGQVVALILVAFPTWATLKQLFNFIGWHLPAQEMEGSGASYMRNHLLHILWLTETPVRELDRMLSLQSTWKRPIDPISAVV